MKQNKTTKSEITQKRWSTKKITLVAVSFTLLISLVLALVISELIISRLYPQNTYKIAKIGVVSVFKKSDLIPFELKSNGSTHHIAPTHEFDNDITTNSLGYRGPEFSLQKPEGTTRILMLGDSTTFGIGSDDDQTFSIKLQEKLQTEGNNIEVINAGFASGLSPDTYYLYLKDKGINLDPDIVFVNLFLSNDITDLFENDWPEVDEDGFPKQITSRERQIDSQGRLVFRQKDWKYRIPIIRNMHVGILTLNLIEQKFPQGEKLIRSLVNSPDLLEDISLEEKEQCLYLNDCTQRFEDQYKRLTKIFQGFKRLSDSTNIPIIITLMPPQFQLTARPEREEVDNNLQTKIPSTDETNQNFPQKRIIETLNEIELEQFDLLKALRGSINPQISNSYVFKDDRHYTPEGNEAIAQAYKSLPALQAVLN